MRLRRRQFDADLEEEMRLHLELREDEGVREGMTREAAGRAARLRFGNPTSLAERSRLAWGWEWLDNASQDVAFAFRSMRKSPLFSVTAVLTLALGVGATIAIFCVLDGVLLRPLPYPRPGELVSVEVSPVALDPSLRGMAPEDYFVFHDEGRAFQSVGIYAETDTDRDVNVTGLAEPERVHALNVTHDVFTVLGVSAAFGRLFSPRDDSPGAPPTAVLTYDYWRRRFDAEPLAVGRTIAVDGVAREVIGVLPRDFGFLDMQDLSLVLPLQLDRGKIRLGNFSYFGLGRLKPGQTVAGAASDIARMLPITLEAFPSSPGISVDVIRKARLTPSVLPLKDDVVGNVGTLLWVLMGSVGMVLLIACGNVANLLLVRTEGRQRELALRVALGAGRGRIATQLLHESAVLGLLGSLAGFVVAWAALRLLVAFAPPGLPRIREILGTSPPLYAALALAPLTSVGFGLIPALKHGLAAATGLRGDRSLGQSRELHRTRNVLVGVQVALALILLVCAGLMIRSSLALGRVDPGFLRPTEIQTFRIAIPASDVPDGENVPRLEQQVADKLAGVPGVSSVAFSSAIPMDGDSRLDNVFAEDRVETPGTAPPLRHLLFVSPGYFKTLGIPLLAGRDLTWAETYKGGDIALVSENLAREYWRSPALALGKRIRIAESDDWREIVGVVGNVHDDGVEKSPRTDVYWPAFLTHFQGRPIRPIRYVTYSVRSPLAGSEAFVAQLRAAVWSVDRNLPVAGVYTLGDYYTRSLARSAFTLAIIGIAGAMALVLGAVGLYGVIAYSVSQRTREIAIRLALGAPKSDVLRLVVGEGMRVTLAGLGAGLLASLFVTKLLSSLLFGISAADPLTLGSVALLLPLVALGACALPARRATQVDPMVALRQE
jgi:predicted permease